jgi:hypothetical protein
MPNCSNALLNHLVADIVDDSVDDIIYFIGDDNVIANMLNGPI